MLRAVLRQMLLHCFPDAFSSKKSVLRRHCKDLVAAVFDGTCFMDIYMSWRKALPDAGVELKK